MKKVLIISNNNERYHHFRDMLSQEFSVVRYEENIEVIPDLIFALEEEYFSEFSCMQDELRDKFPNVPVIFLWTDQQHFRILTCENIQDIEENSIPLNDNSLLKTLSEKISSLTEATENRHHLSEIQSDIHKVYQRTPVNGAIEVEYNNFARIYQFVEQLIERSGKPMQTLLLSLVPCKGMEPSDKDLIHAKTILSEVIQQTLRKNDVMTHYSASQMLVLLVDADDAGGHFATNRIINSFLGMYEDDYFEIDYDIRPVGGKQK